MTSHDVVSRCRRIFAQRRVGHGGTLDPDATGVLMVGLGRATRLLRFLAELPKSYVGEVVLGVSTTTLDASGDVTGTWDMSDLDLGDVRSAGAKFLGPIEQVPPMVSAVQVGGRRLHQLARAGVEVERAARPVTIHDLQIDPGSTPGVYRMAVTCSSGTYVRSLAADIGALLGGGAHLRNLRRTAVGPFGEAGARPLEEVGPDDVLPPVEALRGRPVVVVDSDVVTGVSHGKVFERAALGIEGEGPWAVTDPAGTLLAVYEPAGADRVKPAVVLAGEGG